MAAPPLPRAAIVLGALAVLPFAVFAASVWLAPPPLRGVAAFALSAYAAVVIAFIGAIHWGLAFARVAPPTASLVWGIVPSLVAWAALLFTPHVGLAIESTALVVCYLVDRATYPGRGVAAWLTLRLRLTVPAVIACVAGAAGVWPVTP